MGLNYRGRRKLGPLPVWRNVSRSGGNGKAVSWTVKLFGVSWNSRTKKTVDQPGGYSYTSE